VSRQTGLGLAIAAVSPYAEHKCLVALALDNLAGAAPDMSFRVELIDLDQDTLPERECASKLGRMTTQQAAIT